MKINPTSTMPKVISPSILLVSFFVIVALSACKIHKSEPTISPKVRVKKDSITPPPIAIAPIPPSNPSDLVQTDSTKLYQGADGTYYLATITSKWEKGKKDPNALSANPDDARVMALTSVPSNTKIPAEDAQKMIASGVKVEKGQPYPRRLIPVAPIYETQTEQIYVGNGQYKTVTKPITTTQGYINIPPEAVVALYNPKRSNTLSDSVKENPSSEKYEEFTENDFVAASQTPVSTFSIDADGAAYSNIQRFIMVQNQKPPKSAVRLEEMINYFSYDYPNSKERSPIFVDGEISTCPWNEAHKLVRIGIKGMEYEKVQRPASNLVFLVDVSGSMSDELPLVTRSLELLVNELSPNDRVAIVTYAGAERIDLPATQLSNKELVIEHLRNLKQGGATNGAKGIVTAYEIAQNMMITNANNRVILITDGDFNVGVSNRTDLIKLIEAQRETGVFLSVIGCGTDNYNDAALEALADHGNGIFEYLNTDEDGKKIFVEEINKFYTVAKDVKIQIDFNPEEVAEYRLMGYENRKLNKEDFTDDKKDAGDLSSGQSLTALYEIVPNQKSLIRKSANIDALTVNFRYKNPIDTVSKRISIHITDSNTKYENASESLRFSAAVASMGMLLRDSKYKGTSTYAQIKVWVSKAMTYDKEGHKASFLNLVEQVEKL